MNKNNGSQLPQEEIPLGLGMALAQNMQAMEFFMSLTDDRREAVLKRAHSAGSGAEMRALISELSDKSFQ